MSNYILICNNYVVVARGRARIIYVDVYRYGGRYVQVRRKRCTGTAVNTYRYKGTSTAGTGEVLR